MSSARVYQYPKCSTCRKALKWLELKGVDFEAVHIVEETPDAETLLNLMKKSGLPPKRFFNTSGKRYRELGLKDRVGTMSAEEAAEILAGDGMLIKRPLYVQGNTVLVGFREAQWEELHV
ncbi:MAG: arsenate reductase family protein [Spirochaetales bacterium]|nr:arsenate reductase family protein [Spirochaetales bacterium]